MRFLPSFRRAALLGLTLGASACDVADFASNPKPIFEQTWDLPAPSTSISVASILPAGNTIQILPDSSAFSLSVSGTNITRRVGDDCQVCENKNGTNDFKPLFTLNAGNSAALPADVVAAAVSGGQIDLALTNNMSFDPLYVNTTPGATTQGFLVTTVRSCSVEIGRDSVRGAATVSGTQNTPWAPGNVLNRTIVLNTGAVSATCPSGTAGGITVDVRLDSPLGDHSVFINANGTLSAVASVPSLNVASVNLNVTNRPIDAGDQELPFGGLDEGITDRIVRGVLQLTINNPFTTVSGNLNVRFVYGPGPGEVVTKTMSLPSGIGVRTVTLDSLEMSQIAREGTTLDISGGVNSTAPITVTPKQVLVVDTRFKATINVGGGN